MKPRDRILGLLLHARHAISSYDIGQLCGLGSWRLYPALHKLELDNLVTSEWEFPHGDFPRHRMYRLKD